MRTVKQSIQLALFWTILSSTMCEAQVPSLQLQWPWTSGPILQIGHLYDIRWTSANSSHLSIQYSTDGESQQELVQ